MACKCCSGNCCSLRCFLMVLMLLTGGATIGLSVFIFLCVPAIRMIENPVWAGGPLLLAALLSTVYCCPRRRSRKQKGENQFDEEEEDEDSGCIFAVKVLCVIFLAISFILCLIGAVFCAVHIVQYYMYAFCVPQPDDHSCVCFSSMDKDSKQTEYSPVAGCDEVYRKVIYTIMASGFSCLIGSWEAMVFIGSIFSSRYGQIETGL